MIRGVIHTLERGREILSDVRNGTNPVWVGSYRSLQWYVVGTCAKKCGRSRRSQCAQRYINASHPARVPHVAVLVLTMTSTPTKIFKDGKLRPGIYKIQNLYTKGFLDAYEHSKEMCCRPVKGPEEGLVRGYPLPVVRV